jgi:hypothetical protein
MGCGEVAEGCVKWRALVWFAVPYYVRWIGRRDAEYWSRRLLNEHAPPARPPAGRCTYTTQPIPSVRAALPHVANHSVTSTEIKEVIRTVVVVLCSAVQDNSSGQLLDVK